jgi:predicted Rossmann-fold nucleotide-binding protein
MRTIIAGSRLNNDYKMLCKALETCPFTDEITEVVSGGANGVDKMGERWAKENNKPVRHFLPAWDAIEVPGAVVRTNKWGKKYNAKAGTTRNAEMADYADALIALDEGTPGTTDMIRQARAKGLEVYVYSPNQKQEVTYIF